MRPQAALRMFEWAFFVAVLITIGLGRWFVMRLAPTDEIAAPAMIEGLLVAQVGLLIAWGSLGPGQWFLRLPLAAMLLYAIFALQLYIMPEGIVSASPFSVNSDALLRYWLIACEAALAGCLLVGLRMAGFHVGRIGESSPIGRDEFHPRWSLKTLIALTLLGALLIKVGMVLREYWVAHSNSHTWIAGMLLSVPVSSVILLGFWTVLRPRGVFLRLLCVAPIAGVLAFLVAAALGPTYADVTTPVLVVLGYEAAVVLIVLGGVRLCGFRLLGPDSRRRTCEVQPIQNEMSRGRETVERELQVTS